MNMSFVFYLFIEISPMSQLALFIYVYIYIYIDYFIKCYGCFNYYNIELLNCNLAQKYNYLNV